MEIAPFFQDIKLCRKKIAVISSDVDFVIFIKNFFEKKNYDYLIVSFRTSFKEQLLLFSADIIFIDVDASDGKDSNLSDKLILIKDFSSALIALVYSSLEETDMLIAFELGVFDCFSKKENFDIVFSKICNFYRWIDKNTISKNNKIVSFGPFVVNFLSLTVKKHDKFLSLTLSEFKILQRLIIADGEVVSREGLLKEIDPSQEDILDRNIDVHIAALRKKLGPDFHWIVTVRGIGYRFNR